MTKFEKLIYDEKMEAVNNAVNKATDETAMSIAKNLLSNGFSVEDVSINTGIDMSVVEELSESVKNGKTEKNAVPV